MIYVYNQIKYNCDNEWSRSGFIHSAKPHKYIAEQYKQVAKVYTYDTIYEQLRNM